MMANLTMLVNDTDSMLDYDEDPFQKSFRHVMGKINLYGIPILVVVGIVSNVLSVIVFTTTHLRVQSSSVYLASLAVADSGYLLALFIGWFGWVDIHLFHRPFWCQVIVYLAYVCSFVSVWNVASFTIERYLVVCHPFKLRQLTTVRSALIVVICEAVFASLLYSYSLWTLHITDQTCVVRDIFEAYVNVMTHVDTIITLVIPSSIIVLLNIKLYVTVYKLLRKPLTEAGAGTSTSSGQLSGGNRLSDESRSSQRSTLTFAATAPPRCPHLRTTRMLLIVSTVFILLNLPSYVFKAYFMIISSFSSSHYTSAATHRWQEILHILYNVNFGINFFLYSASRKAFRVAFFRLLARFKYNIQGSYYQCLDKLTTDRRHRRRHRTPVQIIDDGGGAYVHVRNVHRFRK